MADIHVLTGSGEQWTLVFHYPVPSGNNDVGVGLQDALARSGIGQQINADGTPGRRTIMVQGAQPGEITVPEENNLDDGSLIEHVVSFPLESGGTSPAEITAAAQVIYGREIDGVIDDITARLRYFGKEASAA